MPAFVTARTPIDETRNERLGAGEPGLALDFRDVIRTLPDPAALGGDARDAFRLVIP